MELGFCGFSEQKMWGTVRHQSRSHPVHRDKRAFVSTVRTVDGWTGLLESWLVCQRVNMGPKFCFCQD